MLVWHKYKPNLDPIERCCGATADQKYKRSTDLPGPGDKRPVGQLSRY